MSGAVVWAVAKGNDLVGANRPVRASAIKEAGGPALRPAGQRGAAFAYAVGGVASRRRRAEGWGATPDVIPLGGPDLLLGGSGRVSPSTGPRAPVARAHAGAG